MNSSLPLEFMSRVCLLYTFTIRCIVPGNNSYCNDSWIDTLYKYFHKNDAAIIWKWYTIMMSNEVQWIMKIEHEQLVAIRVHIRVYRFNTKSLIPIYLQDMVKICKKFKKTKIEYEPFPGPQHFEPEGELIWKSSNAWLIQSAVSCC